MRANVYKLVYSRCTADKGIIINMDMPAKLYRICNDHVVADNAIVCHVHIGHQQAVAANSGSVYIKSCATVKGNTFADNSVIANGNSTLFAPVLQILRWSGNYSTRKNTAVFPDAGAIHYRAVRAYPGAFANFYIFMYGYKG